MAEAVGLIGTLVGVASMAIQITAIIEDYQQKVKCFSADIRALLNETQCIRQASADLESLLKRDAEKQSASFACTSTLYAAAARCKSTLVTLSETLRTQLEGNKQQAILKALV